MQSEKPSGIFNSLRQLSVTAIKLFSLRLELFGTDIQLEKRRIFQGLLSTVIATACFSMGILFVCLLLILMAGAEHQFTVISTLSALFLSIGGFFIHQSRKLMNSASGIFSASTKELRSDLQHLRGDKPDE